MMTNMVLQSFYTVMSYSKPQFQCTKTSTQGYILPQLNGGANLVVDLLGREGEQVRIELSGLSGMDVVALAQTLWKRPS